MTDELMKRIHKLHENIWREKDLLEINRMRTEIDVNTRSVREIEYLKRASEQLRQRTICYLSQLGLY